MNVVLMNKNRPGDVSLESFGNLWRAVVKGKINTFAVDLLLCLSLGKMLILLWKSRAAEKYYCHDLKYLKQCLLVCPAVLQSDLFPTKGSHYGYIRSNVECDSVILTGQNAEIGSEASVQLNSVKLTSCAI